ncbi:polysaccharide pyruvyl transferase family protein [Pseudoalteromonas sp. SR41-1]|uniref:polysaccharide pyruvyl transferase family protein n=1 Tax=Pseudoalteromonas sp. SR41-1 TaxID=2760952 RepID=UPI001600B6A9|nr:polysaccharide pyruvyl transferase family protein [Pseudoalteromonas sp. SR41-1]MBB1279845.1 polysaccharide pyruvyl transferase family protein [Pseudoalteromonas sp. SR41-1]
MSNKVGIVTFHNAHNYGAVLQAYALHRKLSLMGFDPVFIQDQEDFVGEKYSLYPTLNGKQYLRYAKAWVKLLLDYSRRKKRHVAFMDFIANYLPICKLGNKSIQFDSVALGSDQIWNPNITKNIKDIYFGINEQIITDNIFSYAASMGNGMTEVNFTENFKEKLSTLQNLGVRESSLGDMIYDKFSLNHSINLDPTLLLEKAEWDKLVGHSDITERYLLVYEVEKNENTQAVVDLIAKRMDLKVKVISSKLNGESFSNEITTASPIEFLSLFKNANFVVTTSFHGTVFSIINEIPFFTIKFNNGVDLRSSGLLTSVELQERHINSIDDIDDISELEIDFTRANNQLSKLRSISEKYLENSLTK